MTKNQCLVFTFSLHGVSKTLTRPLIEKDMEKLANPIILLFTQNLEFGSRDVDIDRKGALFGEKVLILHEKDSRDELRKGM